MKKNDIIPLKIESIYSAKLPPYAPLIIFTS